MTNLELKQLQSKNLLKPQIYSFDEMKKLLKEQRQQFTKMVKDMPDVFPELKSEAYDEAYQDAKQYILDKLKELK